MVLVAGVAEADEAIVGSCVGVMSEVVVLAEEGVGVEVVAGVFHVGVGGFCGEYFGEVSVGEWFLEGVEMWAYAVEVVGHIAHMCGQRAHRLGAVFDECRFGGGFFMQGGKEFAGGEEGGEKNYGPYLAGCDHPSSMREALANQRFILAMCSREISLGHSASQAPMLVQLPKPSRYMRSTILRARI